MRRAIARITVLLIATLVPLLLLSPSASAETVNIKPAHRYDKVYVETHVNSTKWPVGSVAEILDDGSPLNLVMVSKCPAVTQCIKVYGKYDLASTTTAITPTSYLDGRVYGVTIYVNENYSTTLAYRRSTLFHELGHAVIMYPDANGHSGHVSRSTSIMQSCSNCYPARTKPDAGDLAELNRLY